MVPPKFILVVRGRFCRSRKNSLARAVVAVCSTSIYLLYISEQLATIPEFASLGPLFKSSSKPLELTESETEYVVHCVKHVFANHIVFQVGLRSFRSEYGYENDFKILTLKISYRKFDIIGPDKTNLE